MTLPGVTPADELPAAIVEALRARGGFHNEWMPATVARERQRFTRAIRRMLEETDTSVRGSMASVA